MTVLPQGPSSQRQLIVVNDPSLEVFSGAAGVTERFDTFDFSFPTGVGSFSLSGSTLLGALHMPNYQGYTYVTIQESAAARSENRKPDPITRSNAEKTLLFTSQHLEAGYSLGGGSGKTPRLFLDLRKSIDARIAYNLYDLAPTLDFLNEGESLAAAFSTYYTGASFSRIQDLNRISLGLKNEVKSYSVFIETLYTDFLYTTYAAGLSLTDRNRSSATLKYDFASFDRLNGTVYERITLSAAVRPNSRSELSFSTSIRPSGKEGEVLALSLGLKLDLSADLEEDLAAPGEAAYTFLGAYSDQGTDQTQKVGERVLVDSGMENDVSAVLDMRDKSFDDLTRIFWTYDKQLYKYDNGRAMDLFSPDRLTGKDPSAYLAEGGVCVDMGRLIGTVLENNGYDAKLVRVSSLRGSPHAYVAAKNEKNRFFIFDGFDETSRIAGAGSFAEAASYYQNGFTQMVISDMDGHIEDVLVSRDLLFLDSLTNQSGGQKKTAAPGVFVPVRRP